MSQLFKLIVLVASLSACASPSIPEEDKRTPELTFCLEQRPQVCTMDYRPVCATRDTGVRCVTTPCPSSEQKTYSNACSACADAKVIGHIPDECLVSPNNQRQQ